jgi:hypothetical protein
MNRNDTVESNKQPQATEAKPPNFWEKYGRAPLTSIMKNPKLTPIFLLFLAAAPIAVLILLPFFLR